ncbi:SAM-dependent methyltransferase [Kordiimonas aestuarii]|uniref:SAM-dependent methyltransferase n=1 Tax=Kordiimonas aestuarii TaxID=1005925 RepID=UPI0021D120B6|nr:cyclopropane-fatty-acyl-phospholipid synthase family protein [Kordiimonas aestuarii]
MDGTFQPPASHMQAPTRREKLLSAVLAKIKAGNLDVTFPSGARRSYAGAAQLGMPTASIHFVTWSAVTRTVRRGALGFAESFMDGEWRTGDLTDLLRLLAANMDAFEGHLPSTRSWRFFDKARHFANRNTKSGSRRNISFHYDLGNEFYALWLDPSMTYSAALFEDNTSTLEEAQRRKYARIAEAVGIKKGGRILEIGCGWGGFAEYAASQLGCHVTGVTLSREQLAFAQNRLTRQGLNHMVDLRLQDYRDISGQFDHIVSVEMLEAVGQEYWATYFSTLKRLLKPGGRIGIQVITIENDRFPRYSRSVDFVQKYIFPGGLLPSDKVLKQEFSDAGLTLVYQHDFGQDYAQTLEDWRYNFDAAAPEIKKLGFDERFFRLWRYYLAYCEAGFRQKSIDVSHYILG